MTEMHIVVSEDQRLVILDQEHLKLLSIGYFISACMNTFFSLFSLVYVVLGFVMHSQFPAMSEAAQKNGHVSPPDVGLILGGFGLAVFLFMITIAALKVRVALCLKRRQSRTFCLVIAGISCLGIPYGTLLGVFSFMVLGRTSVRGLFDLDRAA